MSSRMAAWGQPVGGATRLARLGSLLAFGDLLYAPLVEAARNGDAAAVSEWVSSAAAPPRP